MGVQSHLDRITDSLQDIDDKTGQKPPGRARSSGAMPATSSLANFSAEFSELKKQRGHAIVVRLDECDEGPFHTSPLDLDRVKWLKANLEQNPQSTPALLRPMADGRYEIIAGRHRKAALIELGRDSWDAVIRELSDDEAERVAFYDNLLAPVLTDHARYLGFARRKASRGLTNEQLAIESGVGRSTVQRLFAFAALPQEALAHVVRKPSAVGGKLAEELSPLVGKHRERVIEAVRMVVDGELTAGKAPAWVLESKRSLNKPVETTIKQGRATYAKVARRAGRMIISFTNPAEAEAVEAELEELLKRRAALAKSGA